MKKDFLLLILAVGLLPVGVCAQSSLPSVGSPVKLVSPRGDTIPALLLPKKRGFAAQTPEKRIPIYIGWSTYRISNKIVYSARATRLYTLASSDPEIVELYQQYRENRNLGLIGSIGGGALILAGGIVFTSNLGYNIFADNPDVSVSTGLAVGGLALLAVGILGLGVSLKRARSAVRLYDDRYIKNEKVVRLELGSSTATPAGLALYLRF